MTPDDENSSGESVEVKNPLFSLLASLTYANSMTREEFFKHSLPYLHMMNKEFFNIRIIEAGGNPYKDGDADTKQVSTKAAAAALNAALKS